MSIFKKVRHKAQTARGTMKKGAGRLTGNRRLKTEGRVGRLVGALNRATDKVKDAFKR